MRLYAAIRNIGISFCHSTYYSHTQELFIGIALCIVIPADQTSTYFTGTKINGKDCTLEQSSTVRAAVPISVFVV